MDAVAEGYAELLLREPWHWFATLTFSPTKRITVGGCRRTVDRFHPLRGMHLEAADKCFRWWIFELNKSLYGSNWRRIPHGGVVWARGQEFHKSGRVHFHCVIGAPDCDLNRVSSRYRFHEIWFREFGRNQIERPASQDDVAGYVSKYVTKGGEVDFSANFGKREAQIFGADLERQAGNRNRSLGSAGDRSSTRIGPEKEAAEEALLSLTLPVRPADTRVVQRVIPEKRLRVAQPYEAENRLLYKHEDEYDAN